MTTLQLVPSGRALEILAAFGRYHHLTCLQVTNLFYAKTSYKRAGMVLKELTDWGYLKRGKVPNELNKGLWTLTGKGRRFLMSQNIPLHKCCGGHDDTPSQSTINHLIETNDCLVALERYGRDTDGVRLVRFLHESELWQMTASRRTPRADGWVHLKFGNGEGGNVCFWLEADRNNEFRVKWQTKVRAMLDYFAWGYAEDFRVGVLTVLVMVPTDGRRDQLLRWTEDVLQATGRVNWADYFRITSVEPSAIEPFEWLGGWHWWIPFSERPVPLVEGGT